MTISRKNPAPKSETIRRTSTADICHPAPSAASQMKNKDDSELYIIFKKRSIAKTTTLANKNLEAETQGKTTIITHILSQPTTPPIPK